MQSYNTDLHYLKKNYKYLQSSIFLYVKFSIFNRSGHAHNDFQALNYHLNKQLSVFAEHSYFL